MSEVSLYSLDGGSTKHLTPNTKSWTRTGGPELYTGKAQQEIFNVVNCETAKKER
jgi:hypothetical protein